MDASSNSTPSTSNVPAIPTPSMTPAEVIMDATTRITATVAGLRKDKSPGFWLRVQQVVWAQLNRVRAVIADVPRRLSIPPMLMSLNHDLPDPSIPFTEWPNWPQLLQATMENVANHPWCNQAEDLPQPSEELADDGEENTMRTDVKGKGKAREGVEM
ncbi:hypothetical protein SCLCIDRAFT_23965 [Scleroderma citrinum Foug A]|uniref:Uncharacterized protein n=1 Tax=Scleroderma citrinum Foug A TaxID=1036808 RepID=A0A0C3AFT6_9AGAM|nr:hypothetical protein SCLCIDRAFT_23965 [Scleroderma citrinum Foug A]